MADFAPRHTSSTRWATASHRGVAWRRLAPSRAGLVLFGTSAGPEGRLPLQALYRKGLTIFGYGGLQGPRRR